MTKPKLTDLQLVLLATAVQRTDGNILPPPDRLGDQGARIRRSIPPLLKRALIEEVAVTDNAQVWREDGDIRLGLTITAAGRTLVGVEDAGETSGPAAPPVEISVVSEPPKLTTKIAVVLGFLRRDGGATLAELVEATGWLPHTTRAALTGLRKKGHTLDKGTRDGVTAYAIIEAA